MASLFVTEGLTKRYGGLLANDGVAMQLAAGEIRGLIGPNGAGKTTFVNVVTGIERPDAGQVRLAEAPIAGLSPHQIAARGLVRSFQVARVFGNLTVRENLMVPFFASGDPRGTVAGLRRADELLKLSTLDRLANEPAKSLSGGQRMLLQACAGFMIPAVQVHVLDEPFAGINPVVKDTLIELILHEISASLASGRSVKLSSFGSFGIRKKGERVGRNPKTGQEVPITPRRVLVFRPSNIMKQRINAGLIRRNAAE